MDPGGFISCGRISVPPRRCRWRTTSPRPLVLPRSALNDLDPSYDNPSVKLVANCERLLFQRPDDAIYRGVDTQAEADIAGPGNFLSNFEPITIDGARALVEHVVEFDQYSEPMKQFLADFADHARDGLRRFLGASACGGRKAHDQPPLSAAAAGPGESARDSIWREIAARLARGIPVVAPGLFAGQRGACRKKEQSGGCQGRPAAAGGAQPDPLPGIAGAVHGFHLQPDWQVAGDHRLRQRRRVDQDGLQRVASGDRSEQRAGVVHSDRVRGLHDVGGLRRTEVPGRPRYQPAGAGDLVPHAGAGARPRSS